MNDIITLSQLITRLAKTTGVDNNTARRFLKAFFATVEDSLAKGDSVSIKNIGTFRRPDDSDIDCQDELLFIPDKVLMNEINRPFEMFEAVELAPGVEFSEDAEPEDNTADEVSVHKSDREPEPAQASYMAPQTVEETIIRPRSTSVQTDNLTEIPPAPPVEPPVKSAPVSDDVPEPEPEDTEKKPCRKSLLWLWIAIAISVACCAGYFAAVHYSPIPEWDDEVEAVDDILDVDTVDVTADSVVAPAAMQQKGLQHVQEKADANKTPQTNTAKAAKQPVYDTVEVSLIRLAVKHYKEKFFWVYIYEANRDVISNPNTIRPGTKVVIPDVSTFPGANREEARKIARQKQGQILAQYEK